MKSLLRTFAFDLVDQKNRPVSNLEFVGKLVERFVAFQFINDLKANYPVSI